MQTRALALAFAALTATCLCAQQPAPPAQADTQAVPAAQQDVPRLSDKDKNLACPEGSDQQSTHAGVYKVGGGVMPPRPTSTAEAEFSDSARKMIKKKHLHPFQATSVISLIVDADGIPQNVCVQRAAGFDLDGQAVKAVQKYRFDPATKDGEPVSAHISVEVSFRLY